jgi:uncharacterized protein (DUF1800 family)
MVLTQKPLQERMVWFWHTHLTSGLAKVSPELMYRQHQLLRTHAMGNVRELLQAITVDAAMLSMADAFEEVFQQAVTRPNAPEAGAALEGDPRFAQQVTR